MIFRIIAGAAKRYIRADNANHAIYIGQQSMGRQCKVLATMPDNVSPSIGDAFIYDTWSTTLEPVSRSLKAMHKRVQGHMVTATFLKARTVYKARTENRLYKKAYAMAIQA